MLDKSSIFITGIELLFYFSPINVRTETNVIKARPIFPNFVCFPSYSNNPTLFFIF